MYLYYQSLQTWNYHTQTVPNKDPHPGQKQRLMDAYNRLIEEVSVDVTNQEIKDIQTATNAMLQRVVDRVNARGVFSVARIIPTGSMMDKTALWKYDKENAEHSLKFDYLAVLKNSLAYFCRGEDPRVLYSRIKEESVFEEQLDCVGCEIVNAPEEIDRMRKFYNSKHIRVRDLRCIFSDCFLMEINRSLVSSCDCFTVNFHPSEYYHTIYFHSAPGGNNHGCDKCTIAMPTGALGVNTSLSVTRLVGGPTMCSLIMLWTSKTKTLVVPDCITVTDGLLNVLQKPRKQISSLTVCIDLLPAIESLKLAQSNDGFVHEPVQSEVGPIHESLKPEQSEDGVIRKLFQTKVIRGCRYTCISQTKAIGG